MSFALNRFKYIIFQTTMMADTAQGDVLIVPKKFPTNLIDMLSPPLPRATDLLFAHSTLEKKLYWDRSHYDSPESQMKALAKSSTLYIGNMAFSTRSCHVLSHFSQIGPVKSSQMGLDRFLKTPCGFCFVEYYSRKDALQAIATLSATKLDGRIIRVELDAGFQPGRQYGRGATGGQVRDDRRPKSDPARSVKRQKTLNWTPPPSQQQQQQSQETSYYGDGDNTQAMEDQPLKNPRFREE
jgi:nuclear cap-binding protein subunit 2